MAIVTSPAAGEARSLPPAAARAGPRYWLHAYRRMVVWNLVDLRLQLPILASVLILQGAGFVVGIGLLFRHIPEPTATFLVTGIPVINLITAGLIFEPQIVADQRSSGSYEFLQSMPVPRSTAAMAWYTVALATALPAVAISLAAGVARYHLHLVLTPALVPAILLTSLTGVLMGYAVAHAIRAPMVARLVSVTLIFVLFGFSPVTFPASHLPAWLAQANRWLPFGSMATIVRSALVPGMTAGTGRAYVVVAAWAAASGLVAAWAVGHRR
ncbi:MAG TPA: ABC transporter permease [Streptosporangiaceae bacterium]|nr:ABC transporter permease [Streptosporangiaceae bacterium]